LGGGDQRAGSVLAEREVDVARARLGESVRGAHGDAHATGGALIGEGGFVDARW